MEGISVVDLEGRTYKCKFCKTPLALADELVSKSFHCRNGKAYLSNNAFCTGRQLFLATANRRKTVCVSCTKSSKHQSWNSRGENDAFYNATLEERMMLSIMHTVADIFCCGCGQIVGWKIVAVREKSQIYKEGKFVLDRGMILDGDESEFNIDTHPTRSDAEDK